MREYLDKQKLLMALNDKYHDMSGMPASYYAGFQYAIKLIERLHVGEEVAPAGHAKWIDIYKNFETAECSNCHSQFEITFGSESNGALWDGFKSFYKYCPNCGAKMDLGDESDDR